MRTQANPADAANNPYNQKPTATSDVDLYEVLQVSPKAEAEVIEAAYKRLALKYHPDRNPDDAQATARMTELNAAYAILHDPQQRINYDRARQGLPPLGFEDEAFVADEDFVPTAPTSETNNYNWDDLPFAVPKASAFNPYRQWVRGKVFLYRHRRQILPYALAIVMVIWLVFLIFGQTTANGTNDKSVSVASPLPVFAGYHENFEDKSEVATNWTLDKPWHLTTRAAASGLTSLWVGDELSGQYAGNINASATLNHALDLSRAQNPVLSFKINGQFDNPTNPTGRDRLYVEIATPGHDFQPIFNISNIFTDWQNTQVDLSRWKNQIILLRFRFQSSTPASGYTGPFIDDISVTTN